MRIGINIDNFATVRKAGNGIDPDPVAAVVLSDMAGADSICCTMLENRKYFNDEEIVRIRKAVRSFFNLRMPATDEMIKFALKCKPDMVTLIPNTTDFSSTKRCLDVRADRDYIGDAAYRLSESGISVSLLIQPEISQIKEASRIGADYVELFTGAYATAETDTEMTEELEKIRSTSLAANKLKLGVFAGGGLNFHNLKALAPLNSLEEVIVGNALLARSSLVGLEKSLKEIIRIIS